MKTLNLMLDFACSNRWEREIAKVMVSAEPQSQHDLCLRVFDTLTQSTDCLSFDSYSNIARCHGLCIAAQLSCDRGSWEIIVLEDLRRRAQQKQSLDAYVMGSIIGLFEAGVWLQENRKQVLPDSFLPTMGVYSIDLLYSNAHTVNSGGSNFTYIQAQLDRVVKRYLRPQNAEVKERLKSPIRLMLESMQQLHSGFGEIGCGSPGPCSWLFHSLVHGVIHIESRNHHELVKAALALTSS